MLQINIWIKKKSLTIYRHAMLLLYNDTTRKQKVKYTVICCSCYYFDIFPRDLNFLQCHFEPRLNLYGVVHLLKRVFVSHYNNNKAPCAMQQIVIQTFINSVF